jgi:hypothetical protein
MLTVKGRWDVKTALALIACLAVPFALCAQEAAPDTDRSPEDTISIVEIAPPVGSKLVRGESVTFVVETAYELNSNDHGFIVVSLTDEDRYNLTPSPLPRADVKKGSGSQKLTVTLEVPDYASVIEVTAALHIGRLEEGTNWSSTVDRVRFDVN